MKRFFLSAALLFSCAAYAQNTTVTSKIVSGNSPELRKFMQGAANITDKNYYDKEGKVIDSATAIAMAKTYEYTLGFGKPAGQTELKHMVFKINPEQQKFVDDRVKLTLRPESSKLWEGETLDLKPLASRTDISKLDGKAVILIFWRNVGSPHGSTSYQEINEVIAKYIGGNKFDVFAITGLSYEDAKNYARVNPILNAHQIIDAQNIADNYELGNKPAIIVTNAQHQITYAITEYPVMTPRILNGLLSQL